MKISIDINDADFNEAIEKGVKGLSEETITNLAKEAISSYLQTKDGIEALVFKDRISSYSNAYSYVNKDVRPEILKMLESSFTKDEVEEYRQKIFSVFDDNGKGLLIDVLARIFANMLADYDFKNDIYSRISQLASAIR